MKSTIRGIGIGFILSGALFTYYSSTSTPATIIKANNEKAYVAPANTELQEDATKEAKLSEEKIEKLKEENEKLQQQVEELAKDNDEEKVASYTLKITRGTDTAKVATQLKKHKIIDNAEDFELAFADSGKASNIQIGSFKVTADLSTKQIIKLLTTPK